MRLRKMMFLWALPLAAVCFCQPLCAEKLAVYHTSDIHGYYFSRADKSGQPHGGFAVLENVLLQEKEPFVILDSGDFSSGNKEANASDGRYSVELMNAAGKTPKNLSGQGYAALTIGNHDSDFGAETLGQMLGGFNGDVLSVNVEGLQIPGKQIQPYKIFNWNGKKVAVIGNAAYAAGEYAVLRNVIENVTILTDGKEPQFDLPCDMRKIDRFEGDDVLRKVVFADGTEEPFDGVFIACGTAGAFELAKKLGLEIADNKICVNENRATNIPGIFAAGDCVPGMQQIAKAVYDGMLAGIEAVRYLKSL